ncbi:hypothetical protein IE81DRAFT_124085 [Ceraceosorus guamensis]|uniref:PAC domain-containing protein n=1 Tax=Ceraceosorus guamensis TaxID=1522189 RepID=A0A316VYQ8_9BASI|nr:hypothetical protein IE81DRAFT_124085 [Ceraceosorus guamensis]PWN42464.1 hypothetical protein IE81DRAFT_124085 [Ceraceosorus guamensis]
MPNPPQAQGKQSAHSDLTAITPTRQESEVSSFHSATSDFGADSPAFERSDTGVQTPESSVGHVKQASFDRKSSTSSLNSRKGKSSRANFREAASAFRILTGNFASTPDLKTAASARGQLSPPNSPTHKQPGGASDARRLSWFRKSPSGAVIPPSPPPDRPLPAIPKSESLSSRSAARRVRLLDGKEPGSAMSGYQASSDAENGGLSQADGHRTPPPEAGANSVPLHLKQRPSSPRSARTFGAAEGKLRSSNMARATSDGSAQSQPPNDGFHEREFAEEEEDWEAYDDSDDDGTALPHVRAAPLPTHPPSQEPAQSRRSAREGSHAASSEAGDRLQDQLGNPSKPPVHGKNGVSVGLSEGDLPPRRIIGGLGAGTRDAVPGAFPMARSVSTEHGSAASLNRYDDRRETFYRLAGARSNLNSWAPSAEPLRGGMPEISNLPNWSTIRSGERTSQPISNVQRDMDWSMRKLINEDVFKRLLEDPLGRHRFREWLVHNRGTEARLDMLYDTMQFDKQMADVRTTSEALFDIYLAEDSPMHVALPQELGDQYFDTLRKQFELKASLDQTAQHLLSSLYKTEFQSFVKAQLIEHNKVKLGRFDNNERTGLGDCYCLTNPRLRENPIVLVSPGFTDLTGYPPGAIIGRNCRFLQGPGTAPESIQRVRDALNAGEPCTELLLNYRRDGTPFFCLLSIIPLRDSSGQLVYFVGAQVNVSGELASAKGLDFLVGGGDVPPRELQSRVHSGYEASPSMLRHFDALQDPNRPSPASLADDDSGAWGAPRVTRKLAAGSYEPTSRMGPGPGTKIDGPLFDANAAGGGRKGQGFVGKWLTRGKRSDSSSEGSSHPALRRDRERGQLLTGAEGQMRSGAHSLSDQMGYFTELYGKMLIFKRSKREIIFATRELLELAGLPTGSWRDVYDSTLIHADLLSLIQGSEKSETRAIRTAVQEAVRNGTHISLHVILRATSRRGRLLGGLKELSGTEVPRSTTVHIAPLKDRDNSSFAFVAVFA